MPNYENKPKKQNLEDEPTEKLKGRALDFIRRYSSDGEQLKQNREDALKAYRRDPYPEDARIPEGSRSKFVMSDTSDVIESLLPSFARIFLGGRDVVRIEGRGREDLAVGDLLNDKVNFDLTIQNNGFLLFTDWFKAALLNKAAFVKYWWFSEEEYTDEDYDGATQEEAMMLLKDKDYVIDDSKTVEPEVSSQNPELMMDEMGMMLPPPPPTFNITGRRVKRRIRRPVAMVVPPEELVYSLKMREIKSEEFMAHRVKKHKFDIIKEYGVKESDFQDEVEALTSLTGAPDDELYQRFKDLGGVGFFQDEEDKDFYFVYECYMKDEERKPIKLCLMGNKTISKEPNTIGVDGGPPFCSLSPIRMPYRAIGHSMYDMVGDLQKLNSALVRYLCNNIYYQTENMRVVNPWKINVADFVTQQRPGGIIRTKSADVVPAEAYFPIPPQPLAGHAFGMLETLNAWRERRTGVTSYNQGLDSESLNKTATGISQIMTAAQQRVEMIARIFAETGVRDLVNAFARMNIDFLDIETNVRLDEAWLSIPDPKILDIQYDVTVDVALGTGSKEVKQQQILGMLDRAMNPIMIQTGVIQTFNIYEMVKTLWIEMGEKNSEKYVTDPRTLIQPAEQQAAEQGILPPGQPGMEGMNEPGIGPAGVNGGAPSGVPEGSPMVQ